MHWPKIVHVYDLYTRWCSANYQHWGHTSGMDLASRAYPDVLRSQLQECDEATNQAIKAINVLIHDIYSLEHQLRAPANAKPQIAPGVAVSATHVDVSVDDMSHHLATIKQARHTISMHQCLACAGRQTSNVPSFHCPGSSVSIRDCTRPSLGTALCGCSSHRMPCYCCPAAWPRGRSAWHLVQRSESCRSVVESGPSCGTKCPAVQHDVPANPVDGGAASASPPADRDAG